MSRRPMTQGRSPERGSTRPDPWTNVTPAHQLALQTVKSPVFTDRIILWSCTINGEPGVAIVCADDQTDPGKVVVMPLFVAITPGMNVELADISGEAGDSGSEGGPERPDRTSVARQFSVSAAKLVAGGGE
jgi:hypothetical protein